MARAVTLATLRARLREVADLGPDTSSGRYPNDRLSRELNASWQRGREIAVTQGDGLLYLKQSTPTTMTAGALNSSSTFGTVAMPADCVSIHGIDVVFSNNNIRSLQAVSWADRNSFVDSYGSVTGKPIGFCPINMGVESTTTVTAGVIAIFPAPDQAYTYSIWYLPKWTDITTDTHVFDGIAGHEDWALWDAVIKIAAGDADMQQVVQLALAERGKAEALLTARVNRIQRVGPKQRRDVASQQRSSRRTQWRRLV